MDINYINLVFGCYITYIVTYIVGHLFVSFIKIPDKFPFVREFTKICIGFYSIICIYSIYKTNGITINIGLLLLGISFFIWLYKNKYINNKTETIQKLFSIHSFLFLIIQLFVLLFYFTFLYFKIKDPINNVNYECYGDFYIYAKIITHLNKTGIEGVFTDWYSGVIPNRNLYHFGELWFCAFFSNFTKQISFNVFYFQLFPLCLTTYFLGASSLIEIYLKPQNYKTYFISILIVFICGISFYIPTTTIFTRGDWWNTSLLFQPKYFVSAIFTFYTFIFCTKYKLFPIIYIGLATIVANMVTAPSILIFIGCVILLLFVLRKITLISAIKFSLPIIVTLVFIGLYTLWIHHLNDINTIEKKMVANNSDTISLFIYLKTAFNCFVGQIIKSFLSLLPFIILLVISIQFKFVEKLKNSIIVFIIFHLSSILSYAIFWNRVDAVQLWTNIYLPLSSIFCFLIVLFIFENRNYYIKTLLLFLIGLSFVQSETTKRFNIINKQFSTELIKKYNGKDAVFFKSKDDYSSIFSKNVNMYAPCQYLIMNYEAYNPICLSIFEIPFSSTSILRNTEKEIIENAVFYKFVQLQKNRNEFKSIENSQIDFIKKFNVKYAFTYLHSTLPRTLQEHAIFITKDTINNISFYELNGVK